MLQSKTANCGDVSNCIRPHEAAELLGYELKTLYQKVYRKQIPHIKCRGKLYFEKEVLVKWLDRQTVKVGYEE